MSLECMLWAKKQDISKPVAKLVLICLADHTSERRGYRCWAGRKSIAKDASISDRAVSSNLKWLEENGYIERSHRHRDDGSRTTDFITLLVDRPSEESSRGGEDNAGLCEESSRHEPVTNQLDNNPPIVPPDRFEEFWSVYPKNVGKPNARKAWAKAIKSHDPEIIIQAARIYGINRTGADGAFTKHPQGWLNDERFLDDPEDSKPPDKPGTALDAFKESIARAKANGNSDITDSDENRDRRDHLEGDGRIREGRPPTGVSRGDCDLLAKQIGFTPRIAGDGEEHSRE